MMHIFTIIFLSIALLLCVVYEKDIDSFFGYDTYISETTTASTYEEGSFRRRNDSASGFARHSDDPEIWSSVAQTLTPDISIPTPSLGPVPESTLEPTPEPSSALTFEPTTESIPESTPAPMPTQTPVPEPTPEPVPTLDLFSCLGEYEDENGNSIILQLDTQFHEMKYAMQFYYNRGFARIIGDDGYRIGSDYSDILFTVKYDKEDYPFTIQVGDSCIYVSSNNQFGPFDGHEFEGTFHMTKQYTVPDWISGA